MRAFREVDQEYPDGLLTLLRGLPIDDPERLEEGLDRFKEQHGYASHDVVLITPHTPNSFLHKFTAPHTHSEDEVRLFLEGRGIFDLQADDGTWYRFLVERGDMIVVPAGRVHRFEPTFERSLRCVRVFKDEAGWVPHYVGNPALA